MPSSCRSALAKSSVLQSTLGSCHMHSSTRCSLRVLFDVNCSGSDVQYPGSLTDHLDVGLPYGQLSDHGCTIGLCPRTPKFRQNEDVRCVATHTSHKKKGATLETRTQFETVKLSDRAPVDSRQPRHVHCGGQSMIYCDRDHYHQCTDHRFS